MKETVCLNQSKSPPYPGVLDWYGLTYPISENFPEPDELTQTKILIENLRSYDIFENDVELFHRETVIRRLESLYKDWLVEMCENLNVPESVKVKVGGKLVPFGSYHLGVHSKGADIDALCVGPGFLDREVFFTSFLEKLKAQTEVNEIQAVEEAFVPLIKLTFDGVAIDLVYAKLPQKSIPQNLDLLNDDVLVGVDKYSVRSLNGYRVSEEILRSVPNVFTFRLVLRAIKLWAKRRNIYSNMMGFLGGVSWAILVARICQVYPNATASTVVIKFFKVYSMWVWPIPICLKIVENPDLCLPSWDPRVNKNDRFHVMPIITPAYPMQNTSYNVSVSSLAIMTEEIKRGHGIAEDIAQKKTGWSKLFEEPDFFAKYEHYIMVTAKSANRQQHQEWVGLVESKIRLLVGSLDRNPLISRAHIHQRSFSESTAQNDVNGTSWAIGLIVNTDQFRNRWVNLTTELQSFQDTTYALAERCKIFEEGMTITASYRKGKAAGARPEVSRQNATAVPHVQAKRVSATRLATKRKGCSDSEIPEKKLRVDQSSSSRKPSVEAVMTGQQGPAPGTRSPGIKRPAESQLQSPTKRFKVQPVCSNIDRSKTLEEGMTITAPDSEGKKTVPHIQTQTVSATRPATETKGCSDSEVSETKPSVQAVTSSQQGPCPNLRSPEANRPAASQLQAKKIKLQLVGSNTKRPSQF